MVQRKSTGIFFPYFQGQRLKDFPEALANILDKENVYYYDALYQSGDAAYYVKPVTEDTLLRVHSMDMISAVKRTGDYEAALYSAGGTVQAAEEIAQQKIDNAFVFTSFGDHHAGRNYFGGMCYFNGAALAIAVLREKGMRRLAIVDTDCHHGDGTRDIFSQDEAVLHVCFCFQDYCDENNNVDIAIPYRVTDEAYIQRVRQEFEPRAAAFNPELIFWEFGYDATQGEYGDKGLTVNCHVEIAKIVKEVTDKICQGRLVTILCGGSSRAVATYTIPRIITHMAELNRYTSNR
jgi:acetoin utilization deacetylase AcuC-like enzyme